MTREMAQKRGNFWTVAFSLIGAINIFDFFYKSAFQTDDLLQGLGFVLMAPLAYYVPSAFSNPFKLKQGKVHINPWLQSASIIGVSLVTVGTAMQWGWL